jgi:hypothetical protein
MINQLHLLKSSKLKSKIHLSINGTFAYCDSNIINLSKVTNVLNCDLCLNCLSNVSKSFGVNYSLDTELRFYYLQYYGGSKFLDSIQKFLLKDSKLTYKQYITAINIFRAGKFRDSLTGLPKDFYKVDYSS